MLVLTKKFALLKFLFEDMRSATEVDSTCYTIVIQTLVRETKFRKDAIRYLEEGRSLLKPDLMYFICGLKIYLKYCESPNFKEVEKLLEDMKKNGMPLYGKIRNYIQEVYQELGDTEFARISEILKGIPSG